MSVARTFTLALAVLALGAPAAPARGALSAGTTAPAAAAASCSESEESLATRLGVPIDVCPNLPRSAASATPAAPTGPSTAGTCTAVERCEAWVSEPYDGPAGENENVGELYGLNANAMATSLDGKVVFVSGTAQKGTMQYDIATLALDAATGRTLWSALWETPADRPIGSVNSVAASDDAVFVTGYTWSGAQEPAAGITLALDRETGELLWEESLPSGGYAAANAVNEDGSRLFVVGEKVVDSPDHPVGVRVDARIVAYDTATGEIVWSHAVRDSADRHLIAWRMDAAGDRVTFAASVLKTFEEPPGATVGFAVATYEASSDDDPELSPDELGASKLVSSSTFGTAGVLPAGIALTADGSRAFLTHANTEAGANLNSAKTFAVDTSTGSLLWATRFDGLAPQAASYSLPWYFNPIDVAPDGSSVYVALFTTGAFSYGGAYTTVAYSGTTGSQRWTHTMGAASNLCWGPCGPSLSVNPESGDVVVAANLLAVNRTKSMTYQYDQNGRLEWFRMTGELPRNATVAVPASTVGRWSSLIHSPDGSRVFIGGTVAAMVVDSASSPDMLAVAFNTGS